ncbi:hypothetical protein [Variovorax sp. RA8]|uniref:hypothetical protein n=1 Tax=Variovorax sp. (strain JCM 16519 / RA8) TaxID=662548 RepID=UPI000AF8E723|nr:hypothetical protein [Variovorax sp. RA8]VTU36491.1 hypothetical protein RA8CHR_05488 [Variovorax sp. RA8]
MNKFGKLLKSICLFWCIAAVGNAVINAMVGRRANVVMHALLLAIGVVGFLLGHWLSKRSTARKVSAAKARWWQADYGFRLAVFLSASWISGSFLWQDSYERDYSVVLGPAVFLLAMYLAYRLFVAPRPEGEKRYEEVADVEPEEAEEVLPIEEPQTSSADRERAMDDLIKRMKD